MARLAKVRRKNLKDYNKGLTMYVAVTQHAIDRFMERSSTKVTPNKAHSIIMNVAQPQRHQIKDGLDLLKEVRVSLDDELVGIFVKSEKRIVCVTVRKKKWN
jgi:hypothetical protein